MLVDPEWSEGDVSAYDLEATVSSGHTVALARPVTAMVR
jgi:hypothetical protein